MTVDVEPSRARGLKQKRDLLLDDRDESSPHGLAG